MLRSWRLGAVVLLVTACSTSSPTSSASPAAPLTAASPVATHLPAPTLQSYPPLPTPTPLPPAESAGAASSIPATLIPIGDPLELSAAGDVMWSQAGAHLARFSIATNHGDLVDPGTVGEIDDIFATPTDVWLANFGASEVDRVDATSGALVAQIKVGAAESLIAVGDTIWVTNHHEGSISRLDTTTNAVIDTVKIGTPGLSGPHQIAEGGGSVWVDESNNHTVIRLDPATGTVVATIKVPDEFQACGGIVASDAVWVTGCHEVTEMIRIDPATNAVVATIPLTGYAQDPVVIGGDVWVPVSSGDARAHELDRINPGTNKVDRRIEMRAFVDVAGSAIAGGDLWVSNGTDALIRIPLKELAGS